MSKVRTLVLLVVLGFAATAAYLWFNPEPHGTQPASNRDPASSSQNSSTDPGGCIDRLHRDNPEIAETDRQMRQSMSVLGNWIFQPRESLDRTIIEPTAGGQFFLGLARGGLLLGRTSPVDDDEALSQLEEVMLKDPTNAAPVAFAAILADRKKDETRTRYYLNRLETTKRFDGYTLAISRELWAQVRTPSDMMAAFGLIAVLPVPDYALLARFFGDKAEGNLIGRMLIQDAIRRTDPMVDLDYHQLEYAAGRKILQTRGEGSNLATPQALAEKELAKNNSFARATMALEANCQISVLAPAVDYLKDHVKAYLAPEAAN